MMADLRWSFAGGWFWAAVVLCVVMLVIALWNVYRRGWNHRHAVVEGLRVILAAIICLILAKPESWQTLMPEDPTEILVLADQSTSMDTVDMTLSDGEKGSRRAWLEEQRALKSTRVSIEWMDFESAESGETNLHAALMRASERGDALGGIVLFSDGDWNAGKSPQDAALALRRQGIPITAIPVGSEEALPDIVLTWSPMPKTLVVDEPTRLPFRVENRFPRDAEVTVTSSVGEEMTLMLGPGEVRHEAFLWKPAEEGEQTLSLTTPVLPGETRVDNNADEITVTIRRDRLQVLVVDSAPRWEFRYLRNALMRDPGVDVSCVLFHPDPEMGLGEGPGYLEKFPESMEALTIYDVVFLGDVGVGDNQLTEEQATQLRGLVERQASGLVFVPGRRGHAQRLIDSPLGDLLPVVLEDPKTGVQEASPSALELTEAGRDSVLTMLGDAPSENAAIWRSLPGFYWHAPVARSKSGATVLAVHESSRNTYGRIPLLVTRPFGSGKVLFLGTDGAWRWRRGVEDLYHYRFWGQVARWMAYQRNIAESDRGRIIHYPDAPLAGREVSLHVTLLDKDRSPMSGVTPTIAWTHPDGEQGTLSFTEDEGGWGVYRGAWKPAMGGAYQLAVRLPNDELDLTANIEVASPAREATGDAARPEVLRRLAEATNGSVIKANAVETLASSLGSLAKSEPIIIRHEWWHHPVLLGLLILGLSVYWFARKRLGLV
ncbi:MAG: putative membrane protein [Verrucomicrobiales bacterium]|jgi:uncharacterized membrane protein